MKYPPAGEAGIQDDPMDGFEILDFLIPIYLHEQQRGLKQIASFLIFQRQKLMYGLLVCVPHPIEAEKFTKALS